MIDEDLKERIDGYCAETSGTRSSLIRNAVTEYLNTRMQEAVFPLRILQDDLNPEVLQERKGVKKFVLRVPGLMNEKLENIARTNGISKNQVILDLLDGTIHSQQLHINELNWKRALHRAQYSKLEGNEDEG